ncbi:hypothetical protein BO86DRAFT_457527 [Aspergillus japonicus CBS 114.51]|uniref:Transmembrane protein n=2 Tax=Aspergillus TaxID=5052 RepID=A0A2V5H587_ASPV1|nr:hypothetical protein BO86DRAFT_457527 [Aspergillus japonicus CBS 114.51]PYI17192.1 hypothetical protein BO99DRAFT_404503 [Aspergillus violaceofuscus CBS 115571]RAH79909.1 hypothetical protein BO86DRAFT_457527 [Aspergillus japonicus CBS 114.51]
MLSRRLSLPAVIAALIAQACAQSVLDAVDGQQKDDSASTSETKSVSSKGMIILCTIVALVIVVGISFTTIFIVFKRRRWQMREALYSTERITPDIERASIVKTPTSQLNRVGTRADTETRSASQAQEAAGQVEKPDASETAATHRGWGSFFSFGRTQSRQ